MKINFNFEAELALKAATTGAEIIKERFAEALAIKTKGTPRDIVTDLDLIIERHIIDILKTSGHKIVGEETSKNDSLSTFPEELTWFIDPIDGTTNFVSSIPFYATSIGLVSNSKFHIGSVVIPALNEIFFTFGDKGSFLNGKVIKTTPTDLNNSLIAVAFSSKSHDNTRRKQEFELFGTLNDKSRGCLRLGAAAINICYVAANRLQAAYGVSNKIWDVAGGLAVAMQAGCNVYVEWISGTNRINYVVGAPGVADEIAQFLNSKKLINVSLISQSSK